MCFCLFRTLINRLDVQHAYSQCVGATEFAGQENAGLENDGQKLQYHTSHGSVSIVRTTSKVNRKCQISGSASSETLGSIFKKICRVDYVGTPPHMQILGSIGSKGACLRMREIVTPGVYFFLFFRFHAPRYRSARWTDHRR